MADQPTMADIEKLSAREAYWRGKYEESQQTRDMLADMLRSQSWSLGTERLTMGSIGAGSSVYYGLDLETLGLGSGVAAVALAVAGFLIIDATVGAVSLSVGCGALVVAVLSRLREKRSRAD